MDDARLNHLNGPDQGGVSSQSYDPFGDGIDVFDDRPDTNSSSASANSVSWQSVGLEIDEHGTRTFDVVSGQSLRFDMAPIEIVGEVSPLPETASSLRWKNDALESIQEVVDKVFGAAGDFSTLVGVGFAAAEFGQLPVSAVFGNFSFGSATTLIGSTGTNTIGLSAGTGGAAAGTLGIGASILGAGYLGWRFGKITDELITSYSGASLGAHVYDWTHD